MSLGQKPDEIRKRMEDLRNSLNEDAALIGTGVRAKTNWRYYVRNYPWFVAGGATAVGYLLVPRRVEKTQQLVPDPDALAKLAKREKLVLAPESEAEATGTKADIMSSLAAFLLAAGSRAAIGYLSNKFESAIQQATNTNESQTAEPPIVFGGSNPK